MRDVFIVGAKRTAIGKVDGARKILQRGISARRARELSPRRFMK